MGGWVEEEEERREERGDLAEEEEEGRMRRVLGGWVGGWVSSGRVRMDTFIFPLSPPLPLLWVGGCGEEKREISW